MREPRPGFWSRIEYVSSRTSGDLDVSGGGVCVLGMSGRPRGPVRTISGDLREATRFAVIDRPCLPSSGDCEDGRGALGA